MEGDQDPGELYTVEAAAKVLGRTPGRVRQLLRSGGLEGEHEGGDESKPWRVYAWSVHAHRDATRGGARERREGTARSPREARECPETGPDMLRVCRTGPPEGARALRGPSRADGAGESTARENFERERARAEEERARADAERERAEELRRELEAERSKGFWSRLFGG